jgi:Uma2 family endonuclease
METLAQEVLAQPQAHKIMQQIQAALNNEDEKRRKFYEKMSEQEKVEFINGKVIVHSPVIIAHNESSSALFKLIDIFCQRKGIGFVGYEKILIQLTRNDYEPDICFFGEEKTRTFTEPKQMFFPAPDFVVEVLSDSTEKRDRTTKFIDYAAHDVEEYWIVHPIEQFVEQYHLVNESYELVVKARDGNIMSFAIPGFEIPVKAIFDRNLNFQVLKKLLSH